MMLSSKSMGKMGSEICSFNQRRLALYNRIDTLSLESDTFTILIRKKKEKDTFTTTEMAVIQVIMMVTRLYQLTLPPPLVTG
ncbi:hypothetical protein C5167_033654 [Papaver somniferum]|uniref:Uncharacterized protein n=1 Tax=Papaver somniferum TaxID=3469 RepID=A0A4Y7KE92_PAPSO|nr:hypothetical protein C5167_033654 [Papaver somniferum]